MGTAYSKKLLVLYILDILQKYTDEEHRLSQKEILEILRKENVAVNTLLGHGGIFKTPGVAQRYLAAAAGAPVTCMETAGEGGSYGMALLAAYRLHRADGETLAAYLNRCVFADAQSTTLFPDPAEQSGFAAFLTQYQTALKAERAVVK